jgi:DNA-binding XRE family transcriptional regulator
MTFMTQELVMTGAQIAGARAMLGLSQAQLAELAGLARPTIAAMEACGRNEVKGLWQTVRKVVDVLQNRGIEFDDAGGVRLLPRDEPRRDDER